MTLRQAYKIIFDRDLIKITEKNIRENINETTLKNAYRTLQKKFHPDLHSKAKPEVLTTLGGISADISNAYNILLKCITNPSYIHHGSYEETYYEKYQEKEKEQRKKQQQELKEKCKQRATQAYNVFEYYLNQDMRKEVQEILSEIDTIDIYLLLEKVREYQKMAIRADKLIKKKHTKYAKLIRSIDDDNFDISSIEKEIEAIAEPYYDIFEDNNKYQTIKSWLENQKIYRSKKEERHHDIIQSVKNRCLRKLESLKDIYINLKREIIQNELANTTKKIAEARDNADKIKLSEHCLAIVTIQSNLIKECERKFQKFYKKIDSIDPTKITKEDLTAFEEYYEELCEDEFSKCISKLENPQETEKLNKRIISRSKSSQESLNAIESTFKTLKEKLIEEIVTSCKIIIITDENFENDFKNIDLAIEIKNSIVGHEKELTVEELLAKREQIIPLIKDRSVRKESLFKTQKELEQEIKDEEYLSQHEENIKSKYEFFICLYQLEKKKPVPNDIKDIYERYQRASNMEDVVVICSKELDLKYQECQEKKNFSVQEKNQLKEQTIRNIENFIWYYKEMHKSRTGKESFKFYVYESKGVLNNMELPELYSIYEEVSQALTQESRTEVPKKETPKDPKKRNGRK